MPSDSVKGIPLPQKMQTDASTPSLCNPYTHFCLKIATNIALPSSMCSSWKTGYTVPQFTQISSSINLEVAREELSQIAEEKKGKCTICIRFTSACLVSAMTLQGLHRTHA